VGSFHRDKRLEALELAEELWQESYYADKQQKLGYAAQLHRFGVFSLPQIAKVVRLNPRYIYDELSPNAEKGGRFEPETLNAMVRIRRCIILGQKVPEALVRTGIGAGTSYTCLVALTGLPYATYYEVSREVKARLDQENLKMAKQTKAGVAQNREEVLKLRANGLTTKEISHALDLHQVSVQRILRRG